MGRTKLVGAFVFGMAALCGSAAADSVEDHLGMCGLAEKEKLCNANRAQFEREFPDAYAGDYQAQRNVAFCLLSGCDGAVRVNRTLGCAWRRVILLSGSPKVDQTDISNYEWLCTDKLSRVERATSEAQAAAIFEAIYKRPIPPAGI